jgi:hypothetical protein
MTDTGTPGRWFVARAACRTLQLVLTSAEGIGGLLGIAHNDSCPRTPR